MHIGQPLAQAAEISLSGQKIPWQQIVETCLEDLTSKKIRYRFSFDYAVYFTSRLALVVLSNSDQYGGVLWVWADRVI